MAANEAEIRRWNDAYWTSRWPRREQLTSEVTAYLLEHLDPSDGDKVLEIGSGAGRATLAVAGRVSEGTVVGADVSEPLVAVARKRAAEQGLGNVSFVVADMQESAVEGAPFDAAASQFGVMFFDQPVRAFTNIRAHLRPGGRLVFICWQAPERNPWNVGLTLASFARRPEPPAPGAVPVGPFSLADPGTTTAVLARAGWQRIEHRAYERVVAVGRDAVFEEGELSFRGVPDDRRDEALAAVEAQLGRLSRSDGRIDAPLAFQVFTAVAPQ